MKKTPLQKSRARFQARVLAIRKKLAATNPGTRKHLDLIMQISKAADDFVKEVAPYVRPFLEKQRQEKK